MRTRSAAFALFLLAGALSAAGVRAEIFVASCNNNSIRVYSDIAFGNRQPLRTIEGASTTLDCPKDVAVDMEHQEIFVTGTQDSITVFALHADGNVAPLRKVQGASTLISDAEGVDVDPVHNEIFVAEDNNHAVLVFARTANGNAAPVRQITGASTTLNTVAGVDYVPQTDELVVAASALGSGDWGILTFNRTDAGNVAPERAIRGAATQLDDLLRAVVVDAEDEEVFVSMRGSGSSDRVLVFARTGDGNIAPLRTIQPLGTSLVLAGLALTPRGELLAAISQDQVRGVLKTVSGDAAGQRNLLGGSTGLDNPFGIATNEGLEAPLPDGPFLTSDELPDFRVKVRITGATQIPGTKVEDCINNTLCVAGAIPAQSEIYVRVVGPKPNGFLWPTLVKFNTTRTEVWVQQISTGQTRYYLLENSTQDNDVLPGLFDRTGFLP